MSLILYHCSHSMNFLGPIVWANEYASMNESVYENSFFNHVCETDVSRLTFPNMSGSCLVADMCVEWRLWDLDRGENVVLAMTGLDAYSGRELITSLAYNSTKGIRCSDFCCVKCSAVSVRWNHYRSDFDPLIATLKPQSNRPLCSNTVIGTLAVDGWAVTLGTVRRGLGGAAACPGPSSLYQM